MSAAVGHGFRLLKLLWENTNVEHTLSQREIRALYNRIYGEDIGTKSLRNAIRQLCTEEDSCVECDAMITRTNGPRSNKKTETETVLTDIRVEHDFSDPELRLLIDLVTYCDGIRPRHRKKLVEKLRRLSSKYFRTRSVLFSEPDNHPKNWDLFLTVELLDEAMQKDRKVSLNYMKYNSTGQLETRKDPNGKARRYILSPYQLAMNDGRYYLICSDDTHDDLGHYRLDRMCNVRILDNPRRPLENVLPGTSDLSAQMQKYCDEHVNMFSGQPIWAIMHIQPEAVPILADVFGQAVQFEEQDGEIVARIHAAPLALETIAKAYMPLVEVLSPLTIRDKVREQARQALRAYDDTSQTLLDAAEDEALLLNTPPKESEADDVSEEGADHEDSSAAAVTPTSTEPDLPG